jgi:hypothetical protein
MGTYFNYGHAGKTVATLTGMEVKGAPATGAFELRAELDLTMQPKLETEPGKDPLRWPAIVAIHGELTVVDGSKPVAFFQPSLAKIEEPSRSRRRHTRF